MLTESKQDDAAVSLLLQADSAVSDSPPTLVQSSRPAVISHVQYVERASLLHLCLKHSHTLGDHGETRCLHLVLQVNPYRAQQFRETR